MNPFLLAAGAQGLGKLLFGFNQRSKADEVERSTYIPEAALENKRLAEQMVSSSTYPGQTQEQEQLNRVTAGTIGANTRNARSSTDILNANSVANVRGINASQQMAQRLAQWKTQGLSRLSQANSQIGAFQNKNEQDYWETKAKLQNAGNTNIFGGLGDVLTGAAGLAAGKKMNNNPWGGFNPYGWQGNPFYN